MQCPYCENEMEEGAIITTKVPLWLKSGEKRGKHLNGKRPSISHEVAAYYCKKCNKLIIDGAFKIYGSSDRARTE